MGLKFNSGAAPSTPAVGKVEVYTDSTDKRLKSIDETPTTRVFVDRASSEALSSKSIDDTCKLINGPDSTKIIQPSLVGMTTGVTLTLACSQTTSQTLNLPATRQAETLAAKPQIAGVRVASPAGIANTSGLMLGLSNLGAANIITPQVTGRVCITISGVVAQSTTADGAFWHIRTGTGTAPSNGGALTGTQSGGQQSMTFLTGVLKVPFCLTTIVTGLTLGTAAWIDLVLGTVTGGTATMTEVMVSAFEL